jgi:hypothetical protein
LKFSLIIFLAFIDKIYSFMDVVIATSTPPQGCLLSFLPFSHFN